jgi:hypothetical protein
MSTENLIREILRVANVVGPGAWETVIEPLKKFGHPFYGEGQWHFHQATAVVADHTASSTVTTTYGPGEWEEKR